ncbi:hypothetical protein AURDEDRAFT_177147 [Auricularia subglabra TFB-10046 SS5]|uniref:Uncharacterized protein n=1 Tax=Auricularia subglabra (strain TFB-10046 / SS5) TaxID=717982 RepID=J0WPI1_AURST|nr:hypothetical protein AURDEDRAFT_177147 [Auricularia subglabra TFB-10046 SS5]
MLASRPRSPTAEVELGIPHYEANDIRATKALVQSLAGLSSAAILRALLGGSHGVELSTRNGPRAPVPTPPASPRPGTRPRDAQSAPAPPPTPVLAPALARAVAEASAPRSRLERTFDGDCFETSTLRLGEMARPAQAAQPAVPKAPNQPRAFHSPQEPLQSAVGFADRPPMASCHALAPVLQQVRKSGIIAAFALQHADAVPTPATGP